MSRNRWLLALAGTLVLCTGLVLARAQTSAVRAAFAVNHPPSIGVLPSRSAATFTTSGSVAVADRPVTIRYTFDGGTDRPITDTDGRHELRPIMQNGGVLRLIRKGVGAALAYPARCQLTREKDCPRAILEGDRDDSLNPGTRSLRYGAAVRMRHTDLADGANVFQKGYSVGGVSQFKLQVDHRLGHPSCVITGMARRIYRAEPAVDVADGTWHRLACARTKDRLTLSVDGVERASVVVPPTLSIANAEPLRIGGKGPGKGNDQFAGEIDDVFLTIGS